MPQWPADDGSAAVGGGFAVKGGEQSVLALGKLDTEGRTGSVQVHLGLIVGATDRQLRPPNGQLERAVGGQGTAVGGSRTSSGRSRKGGGRSMNGSGEVEGRQSKVKERQ